MPSRPLRPARALPDVRLTLGFPRSPGTDGATAIPGGERLPKKKKHGQILDPLEPLICLDNTGQLHAVVSLTQAQQARRSGRKTLHLVELTPRAVALAKQNLLTASLETLDALASERRFPVLG